MGEQGYFASEFLACNFKEGKVRQDLRAAVVQFNEYLDKMVVQILISMACIFQSMMELKQILSGVIGMLALTQ